nr:hypothetical protein [Tanacetum cinerariifolium]
LKDNLRKLKGKGVVDEAVILHPIDPELLKIDVAPLAPKLQNNRTAHYDYLKHTQEETTSLKEIVKHERSLNPLNTSLAYAYMVKKDIKEIEAINIELDHRVSKLISENEHLKQTYKKLYDLIKPTRVRSKEQFDVLINQVNQKSVEISDLNVSLQEKDLVITALKNDLRKLKGKSLVDDVVTSHSIAPKMLKVDVEPLAPKLLNNRTAHSNYLRHTQKQAAILREVVEQEK